MRSSVFSLLEPLIEMPNRRWCQVAYEGPLRRITISNPLCSAHHRKNRGCHRGGKFTFPANPRLYLRLLFPVISRMFLTWLRVAAVLYGLASVSAFAAVLGHRPGWRRVCLP